MGTFAASWLPAARVVGCLPIVLVAVASAADVDVTADTSTGINLDTETGTTAEVFSGVTVSNDNLGGTLIGTAYSAFGAPTTSWTLTNRGIISIPAIIGSGPAVRFGAGGAVNNYGLIEALTNNAIELTAGGAVNNFAGAEIRGAWAGVRIAGAPGSVTNAGTIVSFGGGGINLTGGGSVVNQAGGTVHTEGNNNVAVYVIGGTSRSVENAGTIESVGGAFASGIEIGSGDGSITNHATGTIYGTYNGIYTGSSGTLDIENAGVISSLNGPAIEFRTTGAITNTGTIERIGGGSAITFGGNHVRTLNLGTGSQIVGNVVGGTLGTDNLVLLGAGTESITKFTNFETLSMQGASWTLTGTGTFATSTTVANGLLNLDGVLTSPTLMVNAGALLGGTGSLVGSAVNGGTIAPGNSIGTLTVSGDVSFSAGSFFDVEVGGTPALLSDFLDVGGEAHLGGNGTVRVFPETGSYPPSYTYHILTAAGGVNGCFGGVVSNSAFFTPELDCLANDVFLTLTQNGTAFVDVAETTNQIATAGALQDQGPGNPIFDAVLGLGADDARAAFDQLSGEVHAGLVTALLTDSRYPREAALDRVDAAFAALASGQRDAHGRYLWARGFGSGTETASDGNAATIRQGTGGLIVGVDGLVADNLLLGFEAGVSQTGIAIPDRAATAQVTGFHLGVYGGTSGDGLRLRGGAAYSGYSVDVARKPGFAGFADGLESSSVAGVVQVFGDSGYAVRLDDMTIEPFARLAVALQGARNYAETGGDAALTGATHADLAAIGMLGMRAETEFTVNDRAVTLGGMIGLETTVGATAKATHAFAGGTAFTVSGATPGPSLVTRFGLATEIASGHRLAVNLGGAVGAQATIGLTATFAGTF